MRQSSPTALWDRLTAAGRPSERFLADAKTRLGLNELQADNEGAESALAFRGRSVFLAVESQLACAFALIAFDGLARRIILCPPDLPRRHIPSVLEAAEVDVIVADESLPEFGDRRVVRTQRLPAFRPNTERADPRPTEWVLFTSGTTGRPKMVVHSLESLSGRLPAGPPAGQSPVWSTFYDIRRYGGLQILLRAVLGGGSLVLSDAGEPAAAFMVRAGAHGVTHILGTPSHWRRALMTREAARIAPDYVRLSGEVADQAILDRLRTTYPAATIVHAFASTEAGLGFEVGDGLAGFPAAILQKPANGAEFRVVDGSLRVRSARTAAGYLDGAVRGLADSDGFVDTGDMVERRGERYHFVGRREGIINVGGQKAHPEEIEAVINRHPHVEMSLVRARSNPITGAVVVADVVAKPQAFPPGSDLAAERRGLAGEIMESCRGELAPYKVPATIHIVPSLDIAPSGKLVRSVA